MSLELSDRFRFTGRFAAATLIASLRFTSPTSQIAGVTATLWAARQPALSFEMTLPCPPCAGLWLKGRPALDSGYVRLNVCKSGRSCSRTPPPFVLTISVAVVCVRWKNTAARRRPLRLTPTRPPCPHSFLLTSPCRRRIKGSPVGEGANGRSSFLLPYPCFLSPVSSFMHFPEPTAPLRWRTPSSGARVDCKL
jgi:hypothetical protein